MNCEEFSGLYELYALGLLEDPESSELRAHLDRNCPTCTPAVRKARAFNAAILAAAPDAAPSPNLRRRVLASVGAEQHTWSWGHALRWSPLFAGLLLAIVWVSYQKSLSDADLLAARENNQNNAIELQRARQVLDFLNQPETRQVLFGAQAAAPPQGRIFLNRQRGVVLIAHNLPPLPNGRTYEMWLIPKGGAPQPAGLFQSGTDNRAINITNGPVDPNLSAVAVSVEPTSGSPAPTTQPLFAAPVTP